MDHQTLSWCRSSRDIVPHRQWPYSQIPFQIKGNVWLYGYFSLSTYPEPIPHSASCMHSNILFSRCSHYLIIFVANFLEGLEISSHYAKLIRQIIQSNNPASSLSLKKAFCIKSFLKTLICCFWHDHWYFRQFSLSNFRTICSACMS